MSTISDILTSEQNYTTALQAKTDTITGADSENLTQSDFLKLLTEQLQFQDPMSPQDNSQFISQMCQFSQLNVTTSIDTTLTKYTKNAEANSLIGKDVIMIDPSDSTQTLTGIVDAAYLGGKNAGVTVGGTTYSLDNVIYSVNPSAISTTSTTNTTSSTK